MDPTTARAWFCDVHLHASAAIAGVPTVAAPGCSASALLEPSSGRLRPGDADAGTASCRRRAARSDGHGAPLWASSRFLATTPSQGSKEAASGWSGSGGNRCGVLWREVRRGREGGGGDQPAVPALCARRRGTEPAHLADDVPADVVPVPAGAPYRAAGRRSWRGLHCGAFPRRGQRGHHPSTAEAEAAAARAASCAAGFQSACTPRRQASPSL